MRGTFRPKRTSAVICLIIGILLTAAALTIDIFLATGFIPSDNSSDLWFRGPLLVLGIIGIVLGLYFYPTLKHHRTIINVLFLFPLLFAFFITVILPLFLGLFYSFTDWNGIEYSSVIGVGNYTKMFKDPSFIWSILITFLFVVFNMILVNLVAFLLALLCTSKLPGMGFFRAAYFLPNLIGGIVLGYIWNFIFANVVTLLTDSLSGNRLSMLANTKTAFMAIIIVYVWQYAGYIMLIYITGLNTIPGDVLEAAAIDGAKPLQTLFEIKIPMIAPTITICTFLTLTSAFKQFDVNLALTNGAGAVPNFLGEFITNGTQMLALNIYDTAITARDYSFAQAKAFLFFIILACVSIIQVRISNKKEVEL
ncbi:raffinose/stachyose/melibiose transport system permease protein [Butyrivibrio sp. INlla18]|jgi:raffinose/stachyose/melibiose transport system permease protein|uniref:Raffinose/stachyose/melibiose transport system permease protein n=1 Tax=Butyrivibrio hungatei DSM 14810 TaxID=1121132 RepID=A0A1M7SJE9_9FIRM|nr:MULTISPECIES: sugar ABC transporter permease [Butyrivibrio]MBE5840896.1 sugar ABC transporter permease [Butyrivibrio sp.]SDA54452.1 raffinose/stachyose/melibiose transport system permease protein [Butyrivibrio sp. INlla18]SHN58615.1 raffinose/stachyose/melibiose transport system permease protein [Butyrivibrio hungatei DSM 14810]